MGRNHDISPFLFPSHFPSESTPGSPLSPSSPSYSSRSTSNLNSSYKSSSSIAGAAPSQCSSVQPPPADAYVGPCAACKINGRRRCSDECYLASYFPSNELHKFSVVDRVFGWENLRNFLQENSNSSNIPLLLVMRDTSQDGEVQSHPKNICVLSEYSNIDNQLDTTTSLVPINPDHFSPNTIMQSKSKNDFPSNPSLGSINDKTQVHKQEFSIPIFSQTSQDRNKALKSLTSAKVYGSRDVNHEALESIPVEFGRATDHLLQVKREKLGDKIDALQQLVSPFGKSDTASVLWEGIEYIKFLHEQVICLSNPYMKSTQQSCTNKSKVGEEQEHDLRSRGLCLVPASLDLFG